MAADLGIAKPWEIGFQPAATPVMAWIESFHYLLLIVTTGIVAVVVGLMLYVFIRFNAKANPVPSKTTHNTVIEIIWTVVPAIILIIIAVPSLKLLYYEADTSNSAMTIKATGNQWFWTYEYPDQGDFTFDSVLVKAANLKPGEHRLLAVDNHVVVPVGEKIRVLTTSNDVIHSWAVPAFGVKMDAVPGRINATWFEATKEGTFYGQCSELCGKDHAFMPIVVDVVSKEAFKQWVAQAKQKYAAADTPATVKVAAKTSPVQKTSPTQVATAAQTAPVQVAQVDAPAAR
ncbi:MAG TPA: cytochrome c oxidase subunit II [Alphaproteobacteria bacterium]|nr:cytochrome c oxidase subunit II [Alphaproteobacteria bacterium]